MNISIRPKPNAVAAARGADRQRLSREAERLLSALAIDGAYTLADPSAPDEMILRAVGSGISLGSGRHPASAGEDLLSAGLAQREGNRRQRIVISAAGQARIKRARWPAETAYLAQHLDLVRPDRTAAAEEGALQDTSESPLAWMARRRGRDGAPLIDAAAFQAGERLRRDLTLSGMLPRMGSDWGAPKVDGGGPRDPASATDARLAARQRAGAALDAVGTDLSGLLIDLCGFLKGLAQIETERGWPARSAKVVARIALGRLAGHYGLSGEAVGPDRGRSRLWRSAR